MFAYVLQIGCIGRAVFPSPRTSALARRPTSRLASWLDALRIRREACRDNNPT
jgi:hypothetical protein